MPVTPSPCTNRCSWKAHWPVSGRIPRGLGRGPRRCHGPASLACVQKGLWAGPAREACHALFFQGITGNTEGRVTGQGQPAGPPGDGACHSEGTRRFPSGISKHRTLWGVCHPEGDRLSRQGSGGGGEGHSGGLLQKPEGSGEKGAGCWRPGSPVGGRRQDAGPAPGGWGAGDLVFSN